MTVRPEIASGASGRQYRPAFVATVLLVGAGLVAVMSVVIVRTGGPTVILGAIAPVVIALCLCALFWLVATPYAIQWDEKALDLAFAFRRDIVEWGDVESYRKFNREAGDEVAARTSKEKRSELACSSNTDRRVKPDAAYAGPWCRCRVSWRRNPSDFSVRRRSRASTRPRSMSMCRTRIGRDGVGSGASNTRLEQAGSRRLLSLTVMRLRHACGSTEARVWFGFPAGPACRLAYRC